MRVYCDSYYEDDGLVLQHDVDTLEDCLNSCDSKKCKSISYQRDLPYCYTSQATGSELLEKGKWIALSEDNTCPGVESGRKLTLGSVSTHELANDTTGLASASLAPEISSSMTISSSSVSSPSPNPTVYDVSCAGVSDQRSKCVLVGNRRMRVTCNTIYFEYDATQYGTLQQCLERCAKDDCSSFTYAVQDAQCYTRPRKSADYVRRPWYAWASGIEDNTCPGAETGEYPR